MISFITTGRYDNYGGDDYIERFYTSVSENLKIIEGANIKYEYLICEWNPINNYLYNEKKYFQKLFSENKNLKDIIIDKSVVLAERLSPDIYYEYFAKNAGLREGSFDFLILLNSDIIIPINTLNDIIQEIKNHKPKTYYRPKFITHIKKNLSQIRKQDLINPLMPFSFISGHSGGDFLVAKKNELIEYGRGYDEQNEGHRSSYKQHHMDTEIMYNMHFSGCSLKFLNNEYLHIAHSHENSAYDNTSNYSGYKNKECWGFIQYPRKKIEDNLTIIYNEEGN